MLRSIFSGRRLLPLLALACGAPPACGPATEVAPVLNEYGNPLSVPPRPTSAEITARDLQTRLYAFAHDSMMGRMAGHEGNMKATSYIAAELRRMGLEPAGDEGTFFQALPFVLRRYSNASTLTVDGVVLRWMEDFLAVPGSASPRPIEGVPAVYGGVLGDTARQISPGEAEGKVVIFAVGGGPATGGGAVGLLQRYAGAAAVATVDLDALTPSQRTFVTNPAAAFVNPTAPEPEPAPANLRITPRAAAALLGAPPEGLEPGAEGPPVHGSLELVSHPTPDYARNVVAILRGSDPELAGEYVALGGHNDHVGFNASPVDHDSARAHALAVQALRIDGGGLANPSAELLAAVTVDMDSLRRVRPPRLDSINNGADDDGSGSMALLEIAESLAAAPVRPRRSILFVWHTSEERGLQGSRWYVENPTVPIEDVVAHLNMDMIGRGRANDVPGGGDDLLFVIGSYRDSRELGEIVAGVNVRQARPLDLDYRLDEPTDWPGYNNLYGRSDHVNYARAGIPIAFFFTGLHHDYHRVTDEPQYIDYPKLERIARFVQEVAVELANRERRPALHGAEGG